MCDVAVGTERCREADGIFHRLEQALVGRARRICLIEGVGRLAVESEIVLEDFVVRRQGGPDKIAESADAVAECRESFLHTRVFARRRHAAEVRESLIQGREIGIDRGPAGGQWQFGAQHRLDVCRDSLGDFRRVRARREKRQIIADQLVHPAVGQCRGVGNDRDGNGRDHEQYRERADHLAADGSEKGHLAASGKLLKRFFHNAETDGLT